MKAAVLSNVNMNALIRLLGRKVETCQIEGYGNELGILMDPDSSYREFDADYTFLFLDLMELIEHDLDPERAAGRVAGWFDSLEGALRPEKIYYISDAYLWGPELSVVQDPGRKAALEGIWQKRLEDLCGRHGNVRILPWRRLAESMGEENCFSLKMWYMGKILLSNEAQKRLCGLILEMLDREARVPKKLLLLDLDNTLWGGLAGEKDHTPIELSEEHSGLAYKNLQRVILQMRRQGVLLAIVSKNNEADVAEILEGHPHMVLRPGDFVAKRINWAPKHENIRAIAEELNLGLESFVFWDDNPAERQLVKELLPQVEVPDFPERPEDLAPAMAAVYERYFAKPVLTAEDREKTAQYAANAARRQVQESAGSYEEYLKNLEIQAVRVKPQLYVERLAQLMNKTNQFNLTTRRYTRAQVEELVRDPGRRVYLYRVADRFGDNGIVAAAVADCTGDVPVLEEFVMSCRVMGKRIEDALVEDMERALREEGFGQLRGRYYPTAKNGPVERLYERLGYEKTADLEQGGREYEIQLENIPKRMYYVKVRRED